MHRPHIALIAICCFTFGCDHSARYYLDSGAKHFAAGRFADAVIDYRKAIQKDATLVSAYNGLGRSLINDKRASEAFLPLKKAVDLAPDDLDAKRQLADLVLAAYLADARRPQNLRAILNDLAGQFLVADADSFDGLRLQGHLAAVDGKYADAAASLSHANQLKPMDPEVTLGLAQVLFHDEKTAAQGERLLVDLANKHPETIRAYDLLYLRYVSTNRPAEAEAILRTEIAARPRDAQPVEKLAVHYWRSGKTREATAALALLINDPKSFPQARLQVGDWYSAVGDRENALASYEAGERAGGPDNLLYRKRMVSTLSSLGRTDRAMALAEATLKSQPHDVELRTMHAVLLARQEKLDSAIQELRDLVKEKGGDATLRFELGRALVLKGSMEAGSAELREAARLRATYVEPRMALATVALDTGQFQEALSAVDSVLVISPDNPDALVIRAGALQGLGRFVEAGAVLSHLNARFPNTPGLDVETGFLDLQQKKFAEAERVFRKSYRPGQAFLRPLVGLARTLSAENRNPEALHLLEADLAAAPNRPAVDFMLADGYIATGQPEKAMQVFQQVAAAQPGLALAQLRIGDLQVRNGDIEHAIATLEKAHSMAPQSVQAAMVLAKAQAVGQRFEDAKQSYRAVLKLDAGIPEALNDLAFLIAETGGSLDEALKLATQASQKAPQDPHYADTVGYVYLKMRKNESAMQVFDNLSEKYPTDPTFRYHHGLTLLETGDKAGAKAEFQAALTDKPAPALAAKIKQAMGRAG